MVNTWLRVDSLDVRDLVNGVTYLCLLLGSRLFFALFHERLRLHLRCCPRLLRRGCQVGLSWRQLDRGRLAGKVVKVGCGSRAGSGLLSLFLVAAGAEEVCLCAPVELAARCAESGFLVLLVLFH